MYPHVSLVMGPYSGTANSYERTLGDGDSVLSLDETLADFTGAGLLLAWVGCSNGPEAGPGPARQNSPETEGYKSRIEISTIGLAKGENYLGNEVYYVEGSLKNNGEQLVQRIELTLCFQGFAQPGSAETIAEGGGV